MPGMWGTKEDVQAYRVISTFIMESRGMSEQDILIKDLPERKMYYLSCKGAWRQLPEMIAKLLDYSSRNGIKSMGPPSGFYYNTPQSAAVNDLFWEVCYPVASDTQEFPHQPVPILFLAFSSSLDS